METYDTLIEGIDALRAQGYVEDFNLKQNCIECRNGKYKIFHEEFVINKSFYFDVNEDPSDQSILYAIESEKYNLKGILINGYGIYSDDITNEMLNKLKTI
ncbi:phosphoribosylpyrophosphate synthetase [Flavobacterium sp. JRM]|nr:phosphoribosylpyrophosphate synthetase [Flavobacterium sp. JRM]